MKKKGVKLIAGVAVVACLGGAYYGLKIYNEKTEQAESEAAEGESIVDIDQDSLIGISFVVGGETASFTKEDGEWKLDGDDEFPVDEDVLLSPLAQLEPLTSERTLTDAEDISEYGLNEPQNTITLTKTDDSQIVITIGDNNSSTGNDYLMLDNDSSTIYTVSTGLRESFEDTLFDYAESEELPSLQASNIVGLRVSKEDGYELYLEDALWKVSEIHTDEKAAKTIEDGTDADSSTINSCFTALSGLSYSEYLEYNCTGDDLAKYGLDDPAAVMTITYQESTSSSSSSSDEDETEDSTETEIAGSAATDAEEKSVSFQIGSTDDYGNYYVQQVGSKQVHTISADAFAQFMTAVAEDWVSTEEETETVAEAETSDEAGTAEETETDTAEETEAGTSASDETEAEVTEEAAEAETGAEAGTEAETE